MDEFCTKVQMFLMRKSREYGELKFLSSRATEESTKRIEDICSSIVNIFQTCGIPIEGENLSSQKECIEAYKYLVFNTNFQTQERLGEDASHGHLVDICPAMSPYLLIQILWATNYEKVLARSLLYLPLDLCTELLEIARKCLEDLSFDRAFPMLLEVTINVYSNIYHSKQTGVQTPNLKETIDHVLANFEEFLLLLNNPKITRLNELADLKKYERYGIILKRLISTIKSCLQTDVLGKPSFQELEKLYKVTFGREAYTKYEEVFIEETIARLDHVLLSLLLEKIKEVDCNVYLGWAELDDTDHKKKNRNEVSLQRSIGNDCYHFLKYLEKAKRYPEETHLVECLQHLASKPDNKKSGYVLTLEELRNSIKEGKKENVKELMNRYREWDRETLRFINENRSMLDKNDCLELLQFLTFTRKRSGKKEWRNFCYNLIMRILYLRSIPEIYEIVMEYITKHNGQNHLELKYTQECFEEFVRLNSNLRTPSNLRSILLFLLRNPKKVLTTLVKITIGHPDYQNIFVSPKDLCLLSPFLSIREENNQILLTSVFRSICMENPSWNPTKFLAFIHAMLNKKVIKVDQLMNNVFIPYLEAETFEVWNLISILANIRFLRWGCTRNTNVKELVIALAKKMTYVRGDISLSRYKSSEIIHHITKILEHFLDTKGNRISNEMKTVIMTEVERIVEPIDKIHFAPLSYFTRMGINVVDVIQDYKRRCFLIINKVKEEAECQELRNYLSDLSFLREDFLRHLISRSTEDEYHQFALEFSTIYCFIFGWNDEIEAYDNFLRLTMEACILFLEYPSIGSRDSPIYLLKCLLKFCETFVKIEGLGNLEEVYDSFIRNISLIDASAKHGAYVTFFNTLFSHLNAETLQRSPQLFQDLSSMVDSFLQQCSKSKADEANTMDVQPSAALPRVSRYYETHQIISACIKVPVAEACECMRKMDELFNAR